MHDSHNKHLLYHFLVRDGIHIIKNGMDTVGAEDSTGAISSGPGIPKRNREPLPMTE